MVVEYIPNLPLRRPLINSDNQAFWDAVKKHQLVIQRCRKCNGLYHPPRPMCPECHTLDTMEWITSAGRGHVYSWVTVAYEKAAYPGIKVPYSVVLVELDEGVRIISNMADCTPEEIYIGMLVEVVFEDIAEDLTLFKFKRREA